MPISKIVTSFSRLRDTELDQKAQLIIKRLTGNTNYTTPAPTLAVVQTALGAFTDAIAVADNGKPADTIIKNQKRDALETLLSQLGIYVQLNGKNDPAILASSGFDLKKESVPVGVLDKPENLKVEPGNTQGSVKALVNKVDGAKSYIFQYATVPVSDTSTWSTVPSTKSNVIINGLTRGKEYAFRVAGLGSDPTQVFSDVISSFVL